MNYIKELNAFYDWLELNELSPSAINLWYALMHINNKAGWIETFTVAESVLCVKTGLTDRTLRKVRNELKQKGRIDFTSRKGGRAPIYKVISFFSTEHFTENNSEEKISTEINSAGSAGDSAGGRSAGSAGDSSALIKLNKTKLNKTNNDDDAYANPFQFFEQNGFGTIGSLISEKITTWCTDLSDDLVLEAMKRAVAEGVIKWAYVEAILRNWFSQDFKTMDQVNAADIAFRNRQAKKPTQHRNYKKATRKELIPNWLDNKEPEKVASEQDDLDAMKKELEMELQKYKPAAMGE